MTESGRNNGGKGSQEGEIVSERVEPGKILEGRGYELRIQHISLWLNSTPFNLVTGLQFIHPKQQMVCYFPSPSPCAWW